MVGYVQAQTDTTHTKNSKLVSGKLALPIEPDSFMNTVKLPKFVAGINLEHFDIGLSKYHIGGDFSLPLAYDFLEHRTWKTHTFGFDALQLGVRFNSNFKIIIAAGLDWNHIRLKRDSVTIKPKNSVLDYESNPDARLKKNRLSSRYLRLPLYFEYRTPQLSSGKRISIVAGPELGFLIDAKLKQKTTENKKIKVRDDFHFEKFRYGVNARVGYGLAGVFFKYYFNDVFADKEAPGLEDFQNLSFGLTFGF